MGVELELWLCDLLAIRAGMTERLRPSELLERTGHRPDPLPAGRWNFYQEWVDVIFLHYQVDLVGLRSMVPEELELDLFEGNAWVSVVAFTMQNVRPRWLPAWPPVSNFHEVNVRTYVRDGHGTPGVYFLSIDAAKCASVALAQVLSALPYRKAHIVRGRSPRKWFEARSRTGMHVQLDHQNVGPIAFPSLMDRWLVERYALFELYRNAVWCYEVHHLPWPLETLQINHLRFDPSAELLPLGLSNKPHLAHGSSGVQILSWPRTKVPG